MMKFTFWKNRKYLSDDRKCLSRSLKKFQKFIFRLSLNSRKIRIVNNTKNIDSTIICIWFISFIYFFATFDLSHLVCVSFDHHLVNSRATHLGCYIHIDTCDIDTCTNTQ